MKYFLIVLVAGMFAWGCSGKKSDAPAETKGSASSAKPAVDDFKVIADQTEPDTLKGSLRAKAEGDVGGMHVMVRYHSPAVRGRIIWGGLVPMDKVWVTGAHMATAVEVTRDIVVNGKNVPAGKYGFFTIPGKDSWILILNRNWNQHLTDSYSDKEDVVRLTVKPKIQEVNQERLQYQVSESAPGQGMLRVRWEKVEVSLPFSVVP